MIYNHKVITMKTKKLFALTAAALMATAFSSANARETHLVDQIDKQFSPTHLTIKAGDSVEFLNSDPIQHNVFSLSEGMSFDLGSYPQGESKTVTFSDPGTYDIECSIHPEMQMTIEVTP